MGCTWEVEVVLGGWLEHQAGARFFYSVRVDFTLCGGKWGIVRSVGGGVGDRLGVAEAWYKFALL